MKTILHKADSRGHANHGWLDSYHTFSFAGYYNPDRVQFGALRVLNDDRVAAGMGFGKHPHNDMEIISIPLSGELEHRDSMGNHGIIRSGDVQAMSAGTGIYHSEMNGSKEQEVRFLQIWILPNKKGVSPRYDQITVLPDKIRNQFYQIVSPSAEDEGVSIHQNAWFHLGHLEAGFKDSYPFKAKGNGLYVFVIDGEANIEGQALQRRDGLGLWETDQIQLEAIKECKLLLMEVPML